MRKRESDGLAKAIDHATTMITKMFDSKIIEKSSYEDHYGTGINNINRELLETENQPISASIVASIHEMINNPATSEVELTLVEEDETLSNVDTQDERNLCHTLRMCAAY